ncbi:hypothetical protein FACS1894104_5890 [Actinomycetota bacterium]|nr:hypothetical protein FACS1894104_5890 [Actinomycetota bacterium]
MPIIVSSVVGYIANETDESEDVIIEKFYKSNVYSLLDDEGSKFWTMSNVALADLFAKEQAGLQLLGENL